MVYSNSPEPPAMPGVGDPDAHGQAALLLSESLLHGLVARSVISLDEAIEVVEIACDVKTEMASHQEEGSSTLQKSQRLLGAIKVTLETDREHGSKIARD